MAISVGAAAQISHGFSLRKRTAAAHRANPNSIGIATRNTLRPKLHVHSEVTIAAAQVLGRPTWPNSSSSQAIASAVRLAPDVAQAHRAGTLIALAAPAPAQKQIAAAEARSGSCPRARFRRTEAGPSLLRLSATTPKGVRRALTRGNRWAA